MQSTRRELPRSKTSGINGLRRYSFRPRRETPHNRALRIIRQPAKHGQHQSPVRCRGVGPCVAQGSESGLPAGDRRERVQQVASGSRQPVEPRHHHHVAAVELVEQRRSCALSVLAPLATSRNTLPAPCFLKSAT